MRQKTRTQYQQLPLLLGEFPVSLFHPPGSAEANQTTVTSGLKLLRSYERYTPGLSSLRMLLESSTWHSTLFFLTWKVKVTPQGRLLFQLAQSAPSTSEREFSSWLTLTVEDGARKGSTEWAQKWDDGETLPTKHQRLRNEVLRQSWPTLRRAGNRNSRQTMTAMHFAAPALEQAIEINDGKLPREFSSIDELSPKAFHTLIASDGGMIADPKKGGSSLPNLNQSGLSERGGLAGQTRRVFACEDPHLSDAHGDQAQRPSISWSQRLSGDVEPGMVRDVYGLPYRLDRPRWPAPMGQAQYTDEPPRTVQGYYGRADRIKALGNAVIPQVVYQFANAVREVLETQDRAASETKRVEL